MPDPPLRCHVVQFLVLPAQSRQRVYVAPKLIAWTTKQHAIRDMVYAAIRPRHVVVQLQVTFVIECPIATLAL